MSYAKKIAAAPNPQAALAAVGQALDEVLRRLEARPVEPAGWGEWSSEPDIHGKELVTVEEDHEGNVTVTLAEVSPEKYEARKLFAQNVLQLDAALPEVEGDVLHAYGVGGPLWLYTGNRELFISYPTQVVQQMVADIEEDDPSVSHEMARDVLKDRGPGELPEGLGDA